MCCHNRLYDRNWCSYLSHNPSQLPGLSDRNSCSNWKEEKMAHCIGVDSHLYWLNNDHGNDGAWYTGGLKSALSPTRYTSYKNGRSSHRPALKYTKHNFFTPSFELPDIRSLDDSNIDIIKYFTISSWIVFDRWTDWLVFLTWSYIYDVQNNMNKLI